ncbi:MAG: fibronectin type III domain-containing protein [Limnospira sp. PMC 1291.21]|uniref:PPP/PP1, 2A, 2B-type Ser/thr protein phosphatase n=3 Tax=Limnospira TaxID=2596745 RepID=A0A9P1NY28_9CYAN|nr:MULTISPECIES: fibronectin type III domain-containing protein [Limnospira]EKD11747.1 metallophosphoesterase [Arthrospira platensis C1]MDY7053512.1 fibronectin type III domain-containing protein [Limnospira fusiformis LS22]QJB27332.1 metallophosphoesterase [Limnospira fusiformis SAG 85.79]EDZ93469.1 metallophosphoesterase [Limnospira maxima CS-328]MDT9177971.1 fibronectin type III domain-containing protein [Limnospira sp. PMC 1238.20]
MIPATRYFGIFGLLLSSVISILIMVSIALQPHLLSDPFLQLPTENSVRVVWFTEFSGSDHQVSYGVDLQQNAIATTSQLTRTREDQNSWVGVQTPNNRIYTQPISRPIWRHEATITDLTPGQRVPYQVHSTTDNGIPISSQVFSLAGLPQPGTPLKILLTSDHQLKPMTAANLNIGARTVDIDAVFMAGDLVNIPDRASEWFDDNRGGAFFPCLQGRAHYQLEKNGVTTTYKGGALIQNVPLFPAIGNHEIMGAFSETDSLNNQFNNSYPQFAAQQLYQQNSATINPNNDPDIAQQWIQDHSFNLDTYKQIFTLPNSPQNYYATTFGDVRLVVLLATNVWRVDRLDSHARGRYRERDADFDRPENWGYGQHLFEPISAGSEQYIWLQQELNSPEFQQAKYKIVMFHHPPHTLGDNIVPAYTDPVQIKTVDNNGKIIMIRYEYPKPSDYLIRDVMPLLEAAGVQLVYYGHSHLWNRFIGPTGINFLESSNVGNSYGAAWGNNRRFVPPAFTEEYTPLGDPNGLQPIIPNLSPVSDRDGAPQPYIASNDITVFSILDTGTATVSSYLFNTEQPNSQVIKFDEFSLLTPNS